MLRIKKVSSDKIIVQLTDSDLEYFDLDIEKNRPQGEDLHKLLFKVMELVKTETGFDPYSGGQVVVEASMSQNGMSLIISKVRTEKSGITREEFSRVKRISVKSSVTAGDIADIAKSVGLKIKKPCASSKTAFIFDNFQDFEKAVCALDELEFSNVYLYRRSDRYALIYNKSAKTKEQNILSEYSVHIKQGDVAADSIMESWSFAAKDESLAEMVNNIRKINYL